jgi:hypothetical protein
LYYSDAGGSLEASLRIHGHLANFVVLFLAKERERERITASSDVYFFFMPSLCWRVEQIDRERE